MPFSLFGFRGLRTWLEICKGCRDRSWGCLFRDACSLTQRERNNKRRVRALRCDTCALLFASFIVAATVIGVNHGEFYPCGEYRDVGNFLDSLDNANLVFQSVRFN